MAATSNQLVEQLSKHKELIDADIARYCDDLLSQTTRQFTSYSVDVTEAFCAILRRGGKRLRGALVMEAYRMLDGEDTQLSLQAARAIELIHAYLLIIDDICDRSLMRRGGPAAHILLTEKHREQRLHGDSFHFGLSQAINAALLGNHLAQVELTQLPVNDTVKLEALRDTSDVLLTTIHGQINDIYNEAVQEVNETQVEHVLTWKTAYYSFLGPLQLGASLAGGDAADREILEEFSRHIGLAFQISDDILGTFGNAAESGKSAQDDLKEGKITLLISRALEKANPQQRQVLLNCLGNQRLTPPDYEACKTIIEETGALDYSVKLAQRHVAEAIAALDQAPSKWSGQSVEFLRALAGFIIDRQT